MNIRVIIIGLELSLFIGASLLMAWVYQQLAGAGFWQAFTIGIGASLPAVLLLPRPKFDIVTRLALIGIFLAAVVLVFL